MSSNAPFFVPESHQALEPSQVPEYYTSIQIEKDDESNYLDLSAIDADAPIALEPGSIPDTKTQIDASHPSNPIRVLEPGVMDHVTDLLLDVYTDFMVLSRLKRLFLLQVKEDQGPIDADETLIHKTNCHLGHYMGEHFLFSEDQEILEEEMNREEFDIEDENDVVFFGSRVFFTVKRTPKARVSDHEACESVPEPVIAVQDAFESDQVSTENYPEVWSWPHMPVHVPVSTENYPEVWSWPHMPALVTDLLAPTEEHVDSSAPLYPVLQEPDIDPQPVFLAAPTVTMDLTTLQSLITTLEAQKAAIGMVGATAMQLRMLVTDAEANKMAETLSMDPLDQLDSLNTELLDLLKQCQ